MSRFVVLVFTILILVGMPRPAHAYLDANTGSLLLQLLVGGLAGLALAAKLMWSRITGLFKAKHTEHDES